MPFDWKNGWIPIALAGFCSFLLGVIWSHTPITTWCGSEDINPVDCTREWLLVIAALSGGILTLIAALIAATAVRQQISSMEAQQQRTYIERFLETLTQAESSLFGEWALAQEFALQNSASKDDLRALRKAILHGFNRIDTTESMLKRAAKLALGSTLSEERLRTFCEAKQFLQNDTHGITIDITRAIRTPNVNDLNRLREYASRYMLSVTKVMEAANALAESLAAER